MLEHIELASMLIIDIETVPQYSTFEEVPADYQSLWEYKTRFQRKSNESPSDFYVRGGIWAEFGKIVCISAAVFITKQLPIELRIKSYCSDNENEILKAFGQMLDNLPSNMALCAHNGKEFDFPYLCRRMLINGISIPSQLSVHGRKPWEVNQIDTLDLWKFGDHKNYTSLNLLAAVFNIPSPKNDIDGSDVHRVYWKDRNLDRIKRYCENDVITTAQLLLKFKSLPLLTDDFITVV